MGDKVLSVIIPTKNRQEYAFNCVKTMLEFNSERFEIIVHDNSDNNSLMDKLSAINDSRVIYCYDSNELSFCANFEKALERAGGEFVIAIGDDDCICPEIIKLVEIIEKSNIDSVVFPNSITYFWPGAIKDDEGKLVIRNCKPYIKRFQTKNSIHKMIETGNYDYQEYAFPKLYHGIVRRKKLDQIKNVAGHYFGGLTPDIYSAVSLAFYIDSIIYINYPFTVAGICAKSGAADSLTGKHTGELSDAPHFRGHYNYQWDARVPYLYSVDTIWAETAFKACNENGLEFELTLNNYEKFFTYIGRRSYSFKERLIDLLIEKSSEPYRKVVVKYNFRVRILSLNIFLKKCTSRIKQIVNGRYVYLGIPNIGDALDEKSKCLDRYNNVFNIVKKYCDIQ